jgi:serine/threonine protein kinase
VIGRGASSVVYLGTQVSVGRSVAVKILDLPGQPELATKLFVNECRTLGQLSSHPNIVTVFDAGVDDTGRPYLVMEYLPDGTLAAQVAAEGPLAVDEVLHIGVQLAGGLQTTHLHHIVHGDIKPQNVLRERSGEVALGDFGVARLTSTATGTSRAPLLTPLHAAPELFDGEAPTVRTDVYELCSTLFQLLDGAAPVGDESDSPLLIVGRLARGERRSLDRSVVSAGVAEVIESGLASDPTARPQTAQDLGERLQEAQRSSDRDVTRLVVIDRLPGAPTDTGPALTPAGALTGSSSSTLPPPTQRRNRVRVVAAVLAVALLGAAALFWERGSEGDASAGSRPESTSTTTSTTSTTTSTTSTTVPGSPRAGIQPGLTYDVPGLQDVSPALAARLGDPAAVVAPLASGVTTFDQPTFQVERLPATLRWQAFNPRNTPACATVMSRELTVVGLWEKGGTWPEHQVTMRVIEFATEGQAREAFSVFSLEQGVGEGECTGFGPPGSTGNDQMDVVHREPPLDLPEGVRYNSWVGSPPAGMANVTSVSTAIVQEGPRVGLVAVTSGTELITNQQMSAFMAGMADRLSP